MRAARTPTAPSCRLPLIWHSRCRVVIDWRCKLRSALWPRAVPRRAEPKSSMLRVLRFAKPIWVSACDAYKLCYSSKGSAILRSWQVVGGCGVSGQAWHLCQRCLHIHSKPSLCAGPPFTQSSTRLCSTHRESAPGPHAYRGCSRHVHVQHEDSQTSPSLKL